MPIEEVPISFREKKEFIDKIDKACEKRGIPRTEGIREALRLWYYGPIWPLQEAHEKMLEGTEALMSSFTSIERAASRIEAAVGKEGEKE